MVKGFQAETEQVVFIEPIAVKMAAFMKAKRDVINRLVERADELAHALQASSFNLVLCHSDIHAGNLLLAPGGTLYIVDWDNPIFAPKERDLMLIGGSYTWHNPRETALFYQGYGQALVNSTALAYYRCERVIWDIAAYCQQLLLSIEGGDDREQSFLYFASNFLPDHEIEIAFRTDNVGSS